MRNPVGVCSVLCWKGGTAPSAPPRPDPPVTERQTEVVAAERQQRMDARKRKGQLATVFGGETGGWTQEDPLKKISLLG